MYFCWCFDCDEVSGAVDVVVFDGAEGEFVDCGVSYV